MAQLGVILSVLCGLLACGGSSARESSNAATGADTIIDSERTWFPDPVDRTQFKLRQLERLAAVFEAEHAYPPASLIAALPPGLDSAAESRALEDSWTTPFRYVASDSTREIRSAGPDRHFETGDDLLVRWRRGAPREDR